MGIILILNGPNLNLLGIREKSIYGEQNFETYLHKFRGNYPDYQIDYFQSNIEGELINKIQEYGFHSQGIIFNAGGYTHTSVALRDAISSIACPVVEVHISNIAAREEFRQISLIAPVCKGSIAGFGLDSYRLAMEALIRIEPL